jgi:ATP-dependent helicase/nuclease subunit A
MVQGVYAELRSRGQRMPRLPAPPPAQEGDPLYLDGAGACAVLGELLGGFAHAYEALKRARSAVDFDDLELLARELLQEREGVRVAWSERFELLMVDEFQDTNSRQLAILRALDRGNLFTVGDELQAIYGFRHADVRLFRARREELAERGASLHLARNFRGRAPLLAVVNALFEERLGTGYAPLLAGREDAGEASGDVDGEPRVELMLSARGGWEDREELAASIAEGLPGAAIWRQAEARMLAGRVAELVASGGAQAGEVVVLLRSVGDLEVYERALQLQGLRTLAAVGGFWGRTQVEDLLAYLRTLANPLDEPALYATLASPLVGISSDGLAVLARAAQATGRGAWETALSAGGGGPELGPDGPALASFCEWLAAERRGASRRTIAQLLARAIDAAGYAEHVLGLDWGERRLANIHKLLRLARGFEASEGRDLRGFLDHVASLKDAVSGREADAPVAGVEPDAVRLMTIHAAKGLEFPVVCVADLGRAPNLAVADLLVDGERLGLRLVRLDGGDAVPALGFAELQEERRQAQTQEEERILYVAMTRARERLLLSGAVDFERWPEDRATTPPIAWLGPALVADLPEIVKVLERPVFDVAVGEGAAKVRCRLNAPAMPSWVISKEATGARPERVGEQLTLDAQGAPSSIRDVHTIANNTSNEEQQPPQPPPPDAPVPGPPATRWERREELPGGELVTLSYTSLSELERCGYRYYLERVLGLAEDRAEARSQSSHDGLEARQRGTLVHRLLESMDFSRPAPPSAADVARLARELGMRVAPGERAEIAELVGAACGTALARRVAAAQGVRREHPFAFSLAAGEPLVTGFIDLLAREADGGFLVLDYKSDRVGAETALAELVERDYGVQRLLYALAVLRDGAPGVEIVHWFLERPEDWVAARYGQADRADLEAQLAQRIGRVRARRFAVSAQPHRGLCLSCPGRKGLCSWGEERTLAQAPGS